MVTVGRKHNDVIFRAIADPTRREILGLLRHRQQTVGEIAANFRTSRPAISKHLRLLRSAGLVVTHKHGTASICGLNAKPLRTVDHWLRDYEVFWAESLRSLKHYVENTGVQNREDRKERKS
ncbi:MAG TPA: metalloregulator ArsR/SmtB family transcription factor [Bryobacteraceae bacterium]